MIRLTLILAVVLVVAMIILPPDDAGTGDGVDIGDTQSQRPERGGLSENALVETENGTLVLVTAEGEELTIDLVIEPATLTAEDAAVNLPPAETSGGVAPVLDDGEEGAEIAEAPAALAPDAPEGTRLRVTGDRVNFRAGPSTQDTILAALTLGTEVELIERVADGWAHLRVTETGLSGYMSEDFLEPAN